ncbi:MAG: 8-amino-7-oxononanoate synthase, partial [Frankiaceae bacterium]|nr:8-amino-7-oxononanoate synthase [Frankiaceae bacterium]
MSATGDRSAGDSPASDRTRTAQTAVGGSWGERIAARNRAIADAGQWRTLRTLDGPGPAFTLDDGRAIVSFASNDYLGLSQHPLVVQAATEALAHWGSGSGSARLIVGSRPIHREL